MNDHCIFVRIYFRWARDAVCWQHMRSFSIFQPMNCWNRIDMTDIVRIVQNTWTYRRILFSSICATSKKYGYGHARAVVSIAGCKQFFSLDLFNEPHAHFKWAHSFEALRWLTVSVCKKSTKRCRWLNHENLKNKNNTIQNLYSNFVRLQRISTGSNAVHSKHITCTHPRGTFTFHRIACSRFISMFIRVQHTKLAENTSQTAWEQMHKSCVTLNSIT